MDIDDHLVSEGALAPLYDVFYDVFKDQGCIKNDNYLPKDNNFCAKFKKKCLNAQVMKMRLKWKFQTNVMLTLNNLKLKILFTK